MADLDQIIVIYKQLLQISTLITIIIILSGAEKITMASEA